MIVFRSFPPLRDFPVRAVTVDRLPRTCPAEEEKGEAPAQEANMAETKNSRKEIAWITDDLIDEEFPRTTRRTNADLVRLYRTCWVR